VPNGNARKYASVASVRHTVIVLLILLAWAVLQELTVLETRTSVHSSRMPIYLVTILMEWLVFVFVLAGIRRRGVSILELVGGRWGRAADIFRDIGIALALWVIALVVVFPLARALHGRAPTWLAPVSRTELLVWIVVSISAGFCEEAIFRGYLQKQFISWSGNVPVGILISAGLFGAGHVYQGAKPVVLAGAFGVLLGILAQWRKSLRPGMVAHTWQDLVSGVGLFFVRKFMAW
jgi:uncharacterized protein